VKKSLLATLVAAGIFTAIFLLVLRKGPWAPLILLGLAGLYFVLTVVSEGFKIYGKKVQDRDRHP
jgi:hypothetical protein